MAVRSFGLDTDNRYVCTVTLTLGDMTLVHETSLGHRQQLCEIISRSYMAVRSYDMDTDLGYVFTVTLTLEICNLCKVMTRPWIMYTFVNNNIQIQRGCKD